MITPFTHNPTTPPVAARLCITLLRRICPCNEGHPGRPFPWRVFSFFRVPFSVLLCFIPFRFLFCCVFSFPFFCFLFISRSVFSFDFFFLSSLSFVLFFYYSTMNKSLKLYEKHQMIVRKNMIIYKTLGSDKNDNDYNYINNIITNNKIT